MTATIPAGMTAVSSAEFFTRVGPLDVHPRPERDFVRWEIRHTRQEIGRSWPGYLCTGPKLWAIAKAEGRS